MQRLFHLWRDVHAHAGAAVLRRRLLLALLGERLVQRRHLRAKPVRLALRQVERPLQRRHLSGVFLLFCACVLIFVCLPLRLLLRLSLCCRHRLPLRRLSLRCFLGLPPSLLFRLSFHRRLRLVLNSLGIRRLQ